MSPVPNKVFKYYRVNYDFSEETKVFLQMYKDVEKDVTHDFEEMF